MLGRRRGGGGGGGGATISLLDSYVTGAYPEGGTASTTLTLRGGGFASPAPTGAACRFVPRITSLPTLTSPLTVSSATVATCDPPATLDGDAEYQVDVLLDGTAALPTVYGPPRWRALSATSVHIDAVSPRGAPVQQVARVTIVGAGFEELGGAAAPADAPPRARCRVASGATTLDGTATVLSATALACELPIVCNTRCGASVSVSLAGGAEGSWSNALPFSYYEAPRFTSITPQLGPALGGTTVTILGEGFAALHNGDDLRCAIGGVVQPEAPSYVSDAVVECRTPWGDASLKGHAVGVAINGVAVQSEPKVRYVYEGLHAPVITDAYFEGGGARLVVVFGGQPTNKGGMHGRAPCAQLLTAATLTALHGATSGYDGMQCEWRDPNTVVAHLLADASPDLGATVEVRPRTLWPAAWHESDRGCEHSGGLCADGASISLDASSPCDRRATADVVEECEAPTLRVRAAAEVGRCAAAPLALDATASEAGGAPLSFRWRVHPQSDAHAALAAALADGSAAAASAAVDLSGALLSGGERFAFVLDASNRLGVAAAPPSSSVRAAAPPRHRPSTSTRRRRCACGAAGPSRSARAPPTHAMTAAPRVLYRWENTAVASERSSVGAETALLYPVDDEDGRSSPRRGSRSHQRERRLRRARRRRVVAVGTVRVALSFDGAIDGAAGGGRTTLAGSNLAAAARGTASS